MPVTEREIDLKTIIKSPKISKLKSNLNFNEPESTNKINNNDKNDNNNNLKQNQNQYKDNKSSFDVLSLNNSRNKQPNFSNIYLRPNSKFIGLQQSGTAKFNIKVEFKNIDLKNSLVTGFLQIHGLTEQYPEITTCFKGEIINNPIKTNEINKQFSFITNNKKWESNFKNDLDHWKKLTNNYNLTDDEFLKKLHSINNNGLIYMRWKEEFLLPDARVKQIKGASFEGFYYIVLNISNPNNPDLPIGSINGLYYHKSSEKFQSLSLNCVENNGNIPIFEFL